MSGAQFVRVWRREVCRYHDHPSCGDADACNARLAQLIDKLLDGLRTRCSLKAREFFDLVNFPGNVVGTRTFDRARWAREIAEAIAKVEL